MRSMKSRWEDENAEPTNRTKQPYSRAKCAFDYSNSEPLLYSDAINHSENPFSLCLVLFISTKAFEKKKTRFHQATSQLSEEIVFVCCAFSPFPKLGKSKRP